MYEKPHRRCCYGTSARAYYFYNQAWKYVDIANGDNPPESPLARIVSSSRSAQLIVDFTGIDGLEAQRFSFGMKNRPLGKYQNAKIYLTFRRNCGMIKISRWQT